MKVVILTDLCILPSNTSNFASNTTVIPNTVLKSLPFKSLSNTTNACGTSETGLVTSSKFQSLSRCVLRLLTLIQERHLSEAIKCGFNIFNSQQKKDSPQQRIKYKFRDFDEKTFEIYKQLLRTRQVKDITNNEQHQMRNRTF